MIVSLTFAGSYITSLIIPFTPGSCSQFSSKAIENISLALKDSKGNKKENEKYNKEIPKPNIKILTSSPYIIFSEQHISNGKVINENSLLPKNQTMKNNALKEKSLTDIKMQDGITTKPNQQLKDSYVLHIAHIKTHINHLNKIKLKPTWISSQKKIMK